MKRIIIGVVFILLGLTGKFALRGTNSPIALVIAGFAIIVIAIIQMLLESEEDDGDNEDVSVIPNPEKKAYVADNQKPKTQQVILPVEVDEETKQSVKRMNKSDAIAFLREKYNLSVKEARLIINSLT